MLLWVQGTEGMLHGFQLWINLPRKDKMCKPRCVRGKPSLAVPPYRSCGTHAHLHCRTGHCRRGTHGVGGAARCVRAPR